MQLADVQRAAHKRHGTALAANAPIPPQPWNVMNIDPAVNPAHEEIFHDRVRGNIVGKFLDNTLDPTTLDNLRLQSDKFTFIDTSGNAKEDGPTKLFLILKDQDPSTLVNIENHRSSIESAKLQDYKNNVKEMISDIQKHHKIILDNGSEYDDSTYLRHIYQALVSGPNDKFNNKINDIWSDVQSGLGYHAKIKPSELLLTANTYYNNLVSDKSWDKVDPDKARIMALTTELEQLKAERNKNQSSFTTGNTPGSGGSGGGSNEGFIDKVAIWRTKFAGQSIQRDGQTWTWCEHHKQPGKWDGLYWKDHNSSNHNEWKKQRDEQKKKPKANNNANSNQNQKQLTISDKLKTALASNLCVSEEDIDRIIKSQEDKPGN